MRYLAAQYEKYIELYINNYCIFIIKSILEKNKNIKKTSEVIEEFIKSNIKPINIIRYDIEKKQFYKIQRNIKEEEIKYVCSNYSISKLIEQEIDMNQCTSNITEAANKIKNVDKVCLDELDSILNNK